MNNLQGIVRDRRRDTFWHDSGNLKKLFTRGRMRLNLRSACVVWNWIRPFVSHFPCSIGTQDKMSAAEYIVSYRGEQSATCRMVSLDHGNKT